MPTDPTPTVTLAEQVRTLIASNKLYREQAHDRRNQLAAVKAERDDAVAALAKRSEELAACRTERDRLREACKAMHQDAVFLTGETTQKCALCGFVGDITRTDAGDLHFSKCSVLEAEAALEDKT